MKYLKTRENFLTGIVEYKNTYQPKPNDFEDSLLIKEVLQNDITWGGSLLGRLINSTLRKLAIGAKYLRVDGLLKKLKYELESIQSEYLDAETYVIFLRGLISTALKQLKSAAEQNQDLKIFLGDGSKDSGLINGVIVKLNKVEDFPDRKELLDALEKFRKELQSLNKNKPSKPSKPAAPEASHDSSKAPFAAAIISILKSILALEIKFEEYAKSTTGGEQSGKVKTSTTETPDIENKGGSGGKPVTVGGEEIDKNKHHQDLIFEDTPWGSESKGKIAKGFGYGLVPIIDASKKSNIKNHLQSIKKLVAEYDANPESAQSKVVALGESILSGGGDDMSKSISAVVKAIYATKGGKGKMGDCQQMVANVISQYDIAVESMKKPEPDKNKESGEQKVPERYLMSYSLFKKINEELDEPSDDQPQDESDNDSVSDSESDAQSQDNADSDESEPSDSVLSAYKKCFSEEDEKKWILDEKEQLEMTTEFKTVKINIDTKKNYDPIVRIANIFGSAYKLFATPQIPSGRPEGRVSQKTWREYKYIGKGGKGAEWSESDAPEGPFAVKAIFNKWEKGVMSMIEDPRLRKIFANPNLSINGNAGAGQTLFKFMNDMLQDETLGDFDRARRTLLEKYFNITDAKEVESSKPTIQGKTISDDDAPKDPNTTFFNESRNFSMRESNIRDNVGTFFILDCKDVSANIDYHILLYVIGTFKESKNQKNRMVFKFQYKKGKDLLKYLEKVNLKEPVEGGVFTGFKSNQDVYLGFGTEYNNQLEFTFEGQIASKFFSEKNLKTHKYKIKKTYQLFKSEVKPGQTQKTVSLVEIETSKVEGMKVGAPGTDREGKLAAIQNKYNS